VVIYRERHLVPLYVSWPLALLAGGTIIATAFADFQGDAQAWAVIGAVFFTAGVLIFLEFFGPSVEIKDGQIRYGLAPLFFHSIAVSNIDHWLIRTYHPLNSDPGGYCRGYIGSYRRIWVPPTHCVVLTLADGSMRAIASEHAERLVAAIGKAKAAHEVPA
jgi:hypothetical protein